ncbi:MAG: hypothetical protein IJO67_00400 [Clostridia bacterium]|nr:hypothetical protein [Clostridia bacterium]
MKKLIAMLVCLCLMIPCTFAEESKTEAEIWLTDRSLELASLFNETLNSDDYISLFTPDSSILNLAKSIRETDFSKPQQVYVLPQSFSLPVMEQQLNAFIQETDISPVLQAYVMRRMSQAVPTMLIGQMGVNFAALNSILTVSNAYICPDFITDDAHVFLMYGEYMLWVTFIRLDTGVITAQTALIHTSALPSLLGNMF